MTLSQRRAARMKSFRPYRSDLAGRISYIVNFRAPELAACILVPMGFLVMWLGSDYGPIEILRAKGGL